MTSRLLATVCLALGVTELPAQIQPPTGMRFYGEAPSPASAADLALVGAIVVDVETGRLLPDHTVLIRGNRIVDVQPTGTPRVAATQEVDARGKYLIPGLWDMHVHSAVAAEHEFAVYLALGVTGVRNMHTTVDTALELTGSIRRKLATGALSGPRFIANGAVVDGPRPAQRGSVPVASAAEARRAVDSLVTGGADFIKVYNLLPREAYLAVIEQAGQRTIPVVGHVPFELSATEAADAGQRSVEHLDGLDFACSSRGDSLRANLLARPSRELWQRTQVALVDTWNAEACGPAIEAYRRNGTWQVPTLVVGWAIVAAESVLADSARMAVVPTAVRASWRTMVDEMPDAERQMEHEGFLQAVETTRLLHGAGVPILAGTDVGNPLLVPGYSLHEELELLVRAGLTPLAALQAATIGPARFLYATDSLGTVAAGRVADLVLLDANPLADIRNTRLIHAVLVNGRILDRRALDALLSDAEVRLRTPTPE